MKVARSGTWRTDPINLEAVLCKCHFLIWKCLAPIFQYIPNQKRYSMWRPSSPLLGPQGPPGLVHQNHRPFCSLVWSQISSCTLKAANSKNRENPTTEQETQGNWFLEFVPMPQSWTHFTSWSADKICIGQRGHTAQTGCCWICCLPYPDRSSHITNACIPPRKARFFTLTSPDMERGSVGAGVKPCPQHLSGKLSSCE